MASSGLERLSGWPLVAVCALAAQPALAATNRSDAMNGTVVPTCRVSGSPYPLTIIVERGLVTALVLGNVHSESTGKDPATSVGLTVPLLCNAATSRITLALGVARLTSGATFDYTVTVTAAGRTLASGATHGNQPGSATWTPGLVAGTPVLITVRASAAAQTLAGNYITTISSQ